MFTRRLSFTLFVLIVSAVSLAAAFPVGAAESGGIGQMLSLAEGFLRNEASALTAKTWDGGGSTNNWSEAANWSDDVVPGPGDTVIFDGTSTKDATIDVSFSVLGIQINSGYSGTVTQANAASVTVGGNDLILNAGTFNGSTNTITINSNGFGALTITGGTFNGGSGDVTLTGDTNADHFLKLLGGTFNSTSGTLFLDRGIVHENGAVFNSNSGTVTFFGAQNTAIQGSSAGTTFNNLNFSKDAGSDINLVGRANIVTGSLSMNEGTISQGSIEARAELTIAPAFDGGSTSLILANGGGLRTITLATGIVLPRLVVNDPNVTVNTSGSGTLVFPHQLALQQGTIDQGSVDLVIGPRLGGGECFLQSGGTFNGSSKTIALNSNGFGAFSQSGGTFNAGSGNIDLNGTSADLTVSGGTFTSTSGTLTATSSFRIQAGLFLHNGGTINFIGSGNPSIDVSGISPGLTVNDVIFNRDTGTGAFLFGKMIVIGTLNLTDGGFTNNGTIEVRNGMNIASTFDGGGPNNLLIANGSGPRTFTFDTSLTLPFVTLNDPNVTLNTSGAGTLNFPRAFSLQQGVFNQGSVDLNFFPVVGGGASFTQGGGTFNGSSNTVTFTSSGFGGFSQSGGIFNAGSGDITLSGTASTFTVSGGTFTSTSGVLTASSDFRIQGGIFNHNNGTVTFTGGGSPTIDVGAFGSGLTFKNVIFNRDNGSGTFLFGKMITIGTLALTEGGFTNNGTIEVRNGMNIASTFDGGGPNNLLVANGSGPRTFTFDTSLTLPFVTLNDPNVTLNTSGAGTLNFPRAFSLQQGVFNQGSVDLDFFPVVGGGASFTQNGGTFNGSSNSIAFTSSGFGGFSQSGGIFNAGSGDITLNGTGSTFTVSGGTFTSTSGVLTASSDFRIQGGIFNHNNGTVTFTGGGSPTIDVGAFGSGLTFKNVIFNRDNGSGTFLFGKMITVGTLNLSDGGFTNNGIIEAQGDVSIAGTFDGGGPNAFTFSGTANQTYTNNGGPNPPGIWTLNKTGGTVNLAGNMDLSNGPANSFNLTAGTISTGNFEVNAGTRTIVRLAGYISGNLRRDFSTTGVKTYDVGTANSYAPVSVNVVAPLSGTQGLTVGEFQGSHPNLDPAISLGRFWTLVEHGAVTANLTFNYIDPLDIHGSETAYRVAQIDSNVNFSTDAQIPINRTTNSFTINNVTDFKSYTLGQPVVTISPANISLQVQGTQTFTGSGGTAPYAYIMAANSSFGSVDPTTGLYTAGTHAGGQDSVKVTDSEGRIAFATINVQPGVASQVLFGQQVNTVNINTPISPAPMVVIQDQFGNAVTTASDPVTVSIANNPGGGTLSGTLTQNAVNGVATFGDLSINAFGNGYTLAANSGSLTSATSSGFNVLGPVQLAFINEQAAIPIIQNTAFSLQVEVRDQFGARFTNASNPIALAIANNPGGGTLSGVTTLNASGGLAVFSGLRIDAPGDGYTFTSTSPTLTPATSLSYNVVSPFVVTNKTDSLPGSLRSAINAANAAPGTQTISFNIPGPAPYHIVLGNALPTITDTIVIDGTTQPGFAGSPIVGIDGRNVIGTSPGLSLAAANCTVKGLSITRFANSSGIATVPTLGGQTIRGNWIGIDPSGSAAGNQSGILASSHDNVIGGPAPNDRNVISANVLSGITLVGVNRNNTVQGNFIGTNAAGTAAFGNKSGIAIGSSGNTVLNNVISGNTSDGISVSDNNNVIQGNLIGLDAAGLTTLGNGGSGINLPTSVGSGNRITGNRMFGNALLGIKLGNRVVTSAGPALPNDPLDPDTGTNSLQNYPVLTSVLSSGGNTAINGTLNSTPSSSYTLEFFSNPTCDASGNGEGETFLGSGNVTTNATGIVSFAITLPLTVPTGRLVTATATDANGNTSEFSACRPAGTAHLISGQITRSGQPVSNVIVSLTGGKRLRTITGSNGVYTFNLVPDNLNYTVTPSSSIFTFTPASKSINNLSADQANQDFTAALKSFTVKGRALSTISGTSFPLAQVSVLAECTPTIGSPFTSNLLTGADGVYQFTSPAGNCTITPTKTNFTFTPGSVNVTVSSNQSVDLTGQFNVALVGRLTTRDNGGVRVMNADTSASTTVLSAATRGKAVFGQNGSLIAVPIAVNLGGTPAQIVSRIQYMNFDGSNPRTIGTGTSGDNDVEPAISADGTKIAYVRRSGSSRTVRLFDVNTQSDSLILNSNSLPVNGSVTDLSWNPNATRLVYTQNGQVVLDVLGTSTTQLTTTELNNRSVMSPDGTKIAFIRRATVSSPGRIVLMSPDGTGQTEIAADVNYVDVAWSPDGARIGFVTDSTTLNYGVMDTNGANKIVFGLVSAIFPEISWGNTFARPTSAGSNVGVSAGATSVTFGAVSSPGQTTVIPIPSASAGTAPGGFSLGSLGAFEISTTAVVSPPIIVCFTVPPATSLTQFNSISVLHSENGTLVDRTLSRTFATKKVCASVASLSPFAIAEQVNSGLPSIKGAVVDGNDVPIGGVQLLLAGAENRTATSDVDGFFTFANLTGGESYNIRPSAPGYIFTEYSQDLTGLSGENQVVFVGAASSFQISGHVSDQNGAGLPDVDIMLNGAAIPKTQTDVNGDFVLTGLPADASYQIAPVSGTASITPSVIEVGSLVSDVSGADFTISAPSAAGVALGGRVVDHAGNGVSKVSITLSGGRLPNPLTVKTNPFGYYRFDDITVGETYVLTVSSKRYVFANPTRVINLLDEISDADFVSESP